MSVVLPHAGTELPCSRVQRAGQSSLGMGLVEDSQHWFGTATCYQALVLPASASEGFPGERGDRLHKCKEDGQEYEVASKSTQVCWSSKTRTALLGPALGWWVSPAPFHHTYSRQHLIMHHHAQLSPTRDLHTIQSYANSRSSHHKHCYRAPHRLRRATFSPS